MRKSLEFIRAAEFLVGVALVLALLVLPSGACANTITIGLQEASVNGGAVTTVGSGNGTVSLVGITYGDFIFNNLSGTGTPILAAPTLSTTSINVSSATGAVLNVFITETGLTFPTGVNSFISAFTGSLSGAVTSVVEQTFVDTSNGLFGGTQLASATFTGTGTGNTSSTNNTPFLGTYSETVEYTITTTGSGSVNDTIDISLGPGGSSATVPEPSALLLSGFGLGGLLLFAKRPRA
jgi:hypothetical protein